jgi:hypothetical protein
MRGFDEAFVQLPECEGLAVRVAEDAVAVFVASGNVGKHDRDGLRGEKEATSGVCEPGGARPRVTPDPIECTPYNAC